MEQIEYLFLIDIDYFQKLKQNEDKLIDYENKINFYVFGIHDKNFYLIQNVSFRILFLIYRLD
jgi:hypothetical protein